MPRKILIVDDNEMNRLILKNMLCEEYEILEAGDGKAALDVIAKEGAGLSAILLDILMPELDGYEVLSRVRDTIDCADIPVIMETASGGEGSRTRALSLGANDFILKPYNPEIVLHCVRNNIALHEAADKLSAIQRDKLTGLYSREAFFEKVASLVAEHESGYYLISSIDIDNFKLINDQFGTLEGDRILKEVSRAISDDMEALSGVAGRISGDNFAVLLPVEHKDVSVTRFVTDGKMTFSKKRNIIFSVGRYVITDLSLPASAIYDRAYIAKRSIKGRYDKHIAYFDEAMLERLIENQQIVEDVDSAVAQHQFEVWYQPQRNHVTGALVGAEALVRWRHPRKGLIPPGDFIPLFEQNGFIYELDKYVWEEAAKHLRRWLDEGRNPVPVSVNISRQDIFRDGFVEFLTGLIERYSLPIELFRLEITESAFAQSTKAIVEVVKRLIAHGFIVEIDDFGSGYSSLNTLKSVPAQVVKLDMRFLEDDNDAERGGNILSSVVRMAKWLGMSVIAEGVEEKAQADYLASIGCSYIQGYLYARPTPAHDYEMYLDSSEKEQWRAAMDAVENLDNNSFWDPKSMDTLIFSSYVGAACIFEYQYNDRSIELLRVNKKFTGILGDGTITIEDTLKLDWIGCLTEDSRERVREVLKRSCETREEHTDEYVFLNIPGAPAKTYLRSTMRVIATSGERMLVYCTSENITAQRMAEEYQKQADETLSELMNNMPGGFVRMKVTDSLTLVPFYFNDGFSRLTGMDRAKLREVFLDDILNGIHTDDRGIVTDALSRMLATGKATSSRYRIRHEPDGHIWVTTFGRITKDPFGDTVLNAYFLDATEQVREEEIQRSLLDNLPSGAGIYEFKDGTMSLTYQNKSYWELVGLNEEAYPDPSAMSAIHPDDVPIVMRELASAIEQRRDVVLNIRLRHLEKGYRRVHLLGRLLFKEDGGLLIYVTFTPIEHDSVSYQQVLPLVLSAMMESTNDMFFMKDMELRYISASRAFANMAGFDDANALIGKTDADIFPEEFAKKFEKDDIRLLEGGKAIVDMIEPIPAHDSAPRYSSTSKYVLTDGDGKKIGIFGVGHDTTEARTTAKRLELLTNSIPGGIAVYEGEADEYGNVSSVRKTYFSDGLCRLFGYTRAEYLKLMEKDAFALIDERDLSDMYNKIRALITKGATFDHVYRAKGSDGELRWINAKAVMGEPNGDRLTVNAVFFDVTDERNAMEKLRMSEELNRLAIGQGKGVVCRYDVASMRLTVPEDADVRFGASPIEEDVPYKNIREGRLSKDTADAYRDFYESIFRGDRKGNARFKRTSSEGYRWIEAHFTSIFSDSGKPVTAVITYFDITESIEKEAAYRKWKQDLSDKRPDTYSLFRCNVTRSVVLDSDDGLLLPGASLPASPNLVIRTANYADTLVVEEDRKRYLSFMSRDSMLLRYSLGQRSDSLEYREKKIPDGYRWLRVTVDFVDSTYTSDIEAYLLFEDIDKKKRAELDILDRAEKDQLTGVYNRRVFTERVEAALTKLKPGMISALFIIDLDGFKQVNDLYGHSTGDEALIEIAHKLSDAFRGDDLICRLGGDEFMVYMGGVSHMSAVRERASLVCALLHRSFSVEVQLSASVGIAISPKDGALFDMLYKKADAALYSVKGSGKDGYALYSEKMGARSFCERSAARTEAAPAHTDSKRRMLIVEDNEVNREYLTTLFSDEYMIDTASDGTMALMKMERYGAGISIVLLDLMMPKTDGFTVLKKMRESLLTENIPVIVVSGRNEREVSLDAIRAGASDFVTKPVDPELLKLRVESAIRKAENERLRARNSYLAIQKDEAKRLSEAKRHSEELSLALQEAEKADLAKSQFLSSMSHEIRTPLNAIIGYTGIAKSEMNEAKSDSERRQASMKVLDCLTKSEVASRHLLTIVNDVLDMSAIESGKLKVDETPFDFRGLITSLTVMFFSEARSKGVDLEVIFDKPTDEWFIGDQLRVNQVLTNLLSNAVKFTPEGGHVTLSITENGSDSDSARFSFIIKDTGIGMTEEYLTHIWTPFEQAEASISRRFGGSGLGLSITKNLVELMGGTISVESKSGEGSTFTVDLSLRRMEQPAKPLTLDFSSINALVVDDDPNTLDYIKLLFDRCGARSMTFNSGRKAISAFVSAKERGIPFNMCLIDWRMPGMDGFTTIAEIRRIAGKELPIVVVTAYDFDEVADHAEKLGISKFISKPLFQSSLYDLLATICGREAPLSAKGAAKYDFSGARVLLVEDNSMNMEVAKYMLLSAKFVVDCAWNGRDAINIYLASKPGAYNAVLMDIHMPDMDGYEATRAIRSSGRTDAISLPIIAMTADAFAEDVAHAREAGMDGHITKPIDTEALFHTLSEAMKPYAKNGGSSSDV